MVTIRGLLNVSTDDAVVEEQVQLVSTEFGIKPDANLLVLPDDNLLAVRERVQRARHVIESSKSGE